VALFALAPTLPKRWPKYAAVRRIMNAANKLCLMNRYDFGLVRVFFVTLQEKEASVRTGPQPTAPLSILH
jgi:hypothetical protein